MVWAIQHWGGVMSQCCCESPIHQQSIHENLWQRIVCYKYRVTRYKVDTWHVMSISRCDKSQIYLQQLVQPCILTNSCSPLLPAPLQTGDDEHGQYALHAAYTGPNSWNSFGCMLQINSAGTYFSGAQRDLLGVTRVNVL